MPPILPFYYLCHINPQKIMELLRYFYPPDHLGSSSWITDNTGRPIQHLHYLPFGEDWIDQRNTSWNAPYTFSGKEKDVETGYGYFGARYYDSGLSIWLSVDPMSDKYPSMSPYNYCANNPVILVDPDGREIERKDPPKFWDALLGKLKIHPKQKQQTTQSETQQSPQVANQLPEVTVNADAMTWENILGIGVLEVGSVLTKLKTALVVEVSAWTACVAGVFTGVALLFYSDTSPNQRSESVESQQQTQSIEQIPSDVVDHVTPIDHMAHARKKQSTGKSGSDRHDNQYTQGGKNRNRNPNRRHGAEQRRLKGKVIN